jgi:hypothetical protein
MRATGEGLACTLDASAIARIEEAEARDWPGRAPPR